jgi:NADPH-dependent 2,4-dienoyl-CoA reductase/sulfur reductase-like enzyme
MSAARQARRVHQSDIAKLAAVSQTAPATREIDSDVLVVGGGLGGVAAAIAACRSGRRVVLTEETDWVGGQLTAQAVPPDEHPWIEQFGCTGLYREFRDGIRAYYRTWYPLTAAAAKWVP